jgi:hypothetical protein
VAGDGVSEIRLGPVAGRADIDLVDAVARLHLAGRRLGLTIVVRDPSAGLRELFELAGLSHLVAGVAPALRQSSSVEPKDRAG